jgi:outer membrane protein TolC
LCSFIVPREIVLAENRNKELVVAASLDDKANVSGQAAHQKSINSGPLSVREVVELALRNNNDLLVIGLNTRIAEGNVSISKAEFVPKVSVAASYSRGIAKDIENSATKTGHMNGASGSATVSYNLFNSGQDRIVFEMRRSELQIAEYEETQKIQSTILEAMKKYYEIILLEAKKDSAMESENFHKEVLESTGLGYELGEKNSIDRLKAENAYYNSKLTVLNENNVLVNAIANLSVFLGQKPDQLIVLEKPKINTNRWVIDGDEQLEIALANRLDLKIAREKRNVSELKLRLTAYGSFYPTVAVNTEARVGRASERGVFTSDSGKFTASDLIASADINVTLNFIAFSGLSGINRVKNAQRSFEVSNLYVKNLELSIGNEVLKICRNLEVYQMSYQLAKDSMEMKKKELALMMERYNNGSASLAELLKTQSEVESAKVLFIEKRHNLLIARMGLLEVTGTANLENIINNNWF